MLSQKAALGSSLCSLTIATYLFPFWFLSDLYLSIFASNLSTLRACLALAAFPVMRQLTKSCVTTWLVLVSAFYLPSAVTAVAPLLISAVVILAAFS